MATGDVHAHSDIDVMVVGTCGFADLIEPDSVRECIAQADALVERTIPWLEGAGAGIDKARELSHEVHHHLREEEKKFFQMSGKILSEAQKTKLAGQYRRDYARMHKMLEKG